MLEYECVFNGRIGGVHNKDKVGCDYGSVCRNIVRLVLPVICMGSISCYPSQYSIDLKVTPLSGFVGDLFTAELLVVEHWGEGDATDVMVRWDFQNDGTWDVELSTDKTVQFQYNTVGIKKIVLEVVFPVNGPSPAVIFEYINISDRDEWGSRVLWEFDSGERIKESFLAVYDGKVYFGSNEYGLYCLDAGNGVKIWDKPYIVSTSPAVVDGNVYIGAGAYEERLYCIDAFDGTEKWVSGSDHYFLSSPAVSGGRVFIGASQGECFCYDANDGILLWRKQLKEPGSSFAGRVLIPAIIDGLLFAGRKDGYYTHCLDVSDGSELWKFGTGWFIIDWHDLLSSPAVTGDNVFVCYANGQTYCLDRSNGLEMWRSPVCQDPHYPIAAGETLFLSKRDNNLNNSALTIYCLEKDTGEESWRYISEPEYGTESYPAYANGNVYYSLGFKVYCINALTGGKVWEFAPGNILYTSPVVADGHVYIADKEGRLFCLNAPESIGDSWPMLKGNAARTGSK